MGEKSFEMDQELAALARQGEARSGVRSRGGPIGSLPAPSEVPRRERLSELADDAQHNTRLIGESLRDVFKALLRIARLPIEAAGIATRRIRPAQG